MATKPYHEQVDMLNTRRLRTLISTLPDFIFLFFRGIEPQTSSRTRIAYAYDLHVFFDYLLENHEYFIGKELTHLEVGCLDQIKVIDLEAYLEYLKLYNSPDGEQERINHARGLNRKMSSLKTMYNYFFRKEMIKTNPAALMVMPRVPEKEIIRLDLDEVAELLDEVENGDRLTETQKRFHEKTRTRDLALMTLLLGTGLRVSECIGLDIKDVDFKNSGVHVHRKGGKEAVVYFSDEVAEALSLYKEEREGLPAAAGHENAFFLSLQQKRMSIRSVENLVKKYARTVTTLKNITPHKLRSTYGTSLYQETGDIYLVADVLGHSDVNTTRKHYAASTEYRLKANRNAVRLRENYTGPSADGPADDSGKEE